jgi:hypothetical protein
VQDFALQIASCREHSLLLFGQILLDMVASRLVKYPGAIVVAPGNKFKRFYKILKDVVLTHTQDIREILLDKDLTFKDKVELLEIKI